MPQERNTKQKQIVYSALCELGHPSATEVYETVRGQHPTVSRGTVFRLLGGFAESGKAKKLRFSGSDDRFDATLAPHSHVRCRVCGAIGDVFSPSIERELRSVSAEGFSVEGYELAFTGVCANCRERG